MIQRTVKIFIGYQIDSKYHSSATIKRVVKNKIALTIKKKLNIKLELKFGDKFNQGEFLFKQVQDAINECEIAIFDISENNPNVLIEVGMAQGAQKYTILLKNKASNNFSVPSDINAFIYLPYKKVEDIANQVISSILKYCNDITPKQLYFQQIWGFNPNDIVHIVCPELSKPEKRQKPEPNEFLYLGKYGDIDSFITLHISLTKLYPKINFKICTAKEFKNNCNSDNLILIGGPDYNSVSKYFMNKTNCIPYKFIEADNDGEEMGIKLSKKLQILKSCFEATNRNSGMDYGFFVKASNPHNSNKKIIMVSGIHTYGVFGSAKCLSLVPDGEMEVSFSNCKCVINKVGSSNFAVHFPVQIVNNEIVIPTIREKDILKLK